MTSRPLHLLLVEDDELDVLNTQRALDRAGVASRVTVARDGFEALDRLRDGTVPKGRRLVLLDLGLPRMSGIEVLRELRADPELRATCVVVLTASTEERDRTDAFKLNVAGYLLKPVTFHQLAELMATLDKYWSLVEMM
jgi:CheY-like chemotaxis protein